MHKLIVLSGPDGAGKTTHMKILIRFLSIESGKTFHRTWIKSPTMFTLIIIRFFEILSPKSIIRSPTGGILAIRKRSALINKKILQSIELISLIIKIFLNVYLPMFIGKIVIADRFIPDSIVHMAYILNDKNFIYSRFANIILTLIPKQSIMFFLDADIEVLVERRKRLADPLPYLKFSKLLFLKLYILIKRRGYNVYYINTSNYDIMTIFKYIIKKIKA